MLNIFKYSLNKGMNEMLDIFELHFFNPIFSVIFWQCIEFPIIIAPGLVARDLICVLGVLGNRRRLVAAQLYFYLCADIRALNQIASG